MTRVWTEDFTGTGYDNTWSGGETVGSGSVVDEDTATPTGGSSPGFDGNCLKIVHTGNQANVIHDWGSGSGKPITYWRAYLVCEAVGGADNVQPSILRATDQSGTQVFRLAWKVKSSGTTVQLTLGIFDGSSSLNFSTASLGFDTQALVEIKYDYTNIAWEWKVNGSTEDSGALSGSPLTEIRAFRAGEYFGSAPSATHYIDTFAIDDAAWIGAASAGSAGRLVNSAPIKSLVGGGLIARRGIFVPKRKPIVRPALIVPPAHVIAAHQQTANRIAR